MRMISRQSWRHVSRDGPPPACESFPGSWPSERHSDPADVSHLRVRRLTQLQPRRARDLRTDPLRHSDGIATITLHRPERLNAYTDQMMREVVDAVAAHRCRRRRPRRGRFHRQRARVLCGATSAEAPQTFAFEADTFSMTEHADGGGILTQRLFRSTKPLIAAINGPAVGVGVTSTLPMDFRLASSSARFGFVFTRRGVVPEACSLVVSCRAWSESTRRSTRS